ncbi:unnamed protein product (macronuclear) [Paramecium tetraurelia]|uniref:Clathrin light chain n=1 Tax=Paramecium tetraurelia TaxID=5888 RepID=A0DB88_PARTE|nr:uncharacterized protein GSPATT00015199001 [Paramecium tetraurelia]CAK80305.1 unnamed protein product [Paramecium tetraurelia]|eukprot:XP_001447702.1 hypothetical protein (macronuclear) [Paramecium tetraurelia strain d4-2]
MDEFFDDPAGTIETYVIPEVAAEPLMFNDAARQPFEMPIAPNAGVTLVSAEQQKRRDKLRELEDERLKQIREKDQEERIQKQQRKEKAQQYLLQFQTQLKSDIQARKDANKQVQELRSQNKSEYKNSWDKIASNIALKDGEYPGEKDVNKMRQAILNKRIDLTK